MVLLNKTDLVGEDEVKKIKKAVAVLNPDAKLSKTTQSKVILETIS